MLENRRKHSKKPPDLIALLDKPMADFKTSFIYSLTAIPRAKELLPKGSSEVAHYAHQFIGRGPHKPFMPFIMCRTPAPLEIIIKMSCQGYGTDGLGLVRPVLAWVTLDDMWAASQGGIDGREIHPLPNVIKEELFPRWHWLLQDDEFEEIMEDDPQAFMTALGFTPLNIE